MTPLFIFLLIIVFRTLGVTFGHLRYIREWRQKMAFAFLFGIIEVSLWLVIIALALEQIRQNPTYAVFYAGGFALGNVLGFFLERFIPLGTAEVLIFAPIDLALATRIHDAGLGATKLSGCGRDGDLDVIFCFILKRDLRQLLPLLKKDERVFYTVDIGIRASRISKYM